MPDPPVRRVPDHVIEVNVIDGRDVGGRCIDQSLQSGERNVDVRLNDRSSETSQPTEVPVLVGVQQQCPRERVDHLFRRRNVSGLLEPGVPGDTDAGELGDLFASQSGGPAQAGIAVLRKPNVGRPQPTSRGAKKGSNLSAVRRLQALRPIHHAELAPPNGRRRTGGRLAVPGPNGGRVIPCR